MLLLKYYSILSSADTINLEYKYQKRTRFQLFLTQQGQTVT